MIYCWRHRGYNNPEGEAYERIVKSEVRRQGESMVHIIYKIGILPELQSTTLGQYFRFR